MPFKDNFNMKDAGAGFMFPVLISLVAQFALGFVWSIGITAGGWQDFNAVQKESFAFLIISGFCLQLLMAGFYFLYTNKRRIDPFKAAYVKNMPARNWLLAALAGVVALFGLMFTSFSFDILFTDVLKYESPELPAFDTAGRAILGVIFMAAVPAIMEEFIFRGIVLRGLKGLGKWKAILISTAAFTLMHMSPTQTVHQFFLGLIMALIAWETGSILAPMLIHFINNALAILLEYSGISFIGGLLPWQIVLIAIVTFLAVCGIIYLILRFIKKPVPDTDGQAQVISAEGNIVKRRLLDERNAFTFFMIGFVATGIVWIFQMIPADFWTSLLSAH